MAKSNIGTVVVKEHKNVAFYYRNENIQQIGSFSGFSCDTFLILFTDLDWSWSYSEGHLCSGLDIGGIWMWKVLRIVGLWVKPEHDMVHVKSSAQMDTGHNGKPSTPKHMAPSLEMIEPKKNPWVAGRRWGGRGEPAWSKKSAPAPRPRYNSSGETRPQASVSQWLSRCFPSTCHSARHSPLPHQKPPSRWWKSNKWAEPGSEEAYGFHRKRAVKSFLCEIAQLVKNCRFSQLLPLTTYFCHFAF